MSFPRLALVLGALGLPLLTGACGVPLALTAGTYGADGASMVGTGKSTSDHFASMVSKRDCALWRVFANQKMCHEQEGNPYNVNYDEPYRSASDGGTEYMAPPHATADAPAASWDPNAYSKPPAPTTATATAAPAVTGDPAPSSAPAPAAVAAADPPPAPAATAPAKAKKPVKARSAAAKTKPKPKAAPKPSPDPAATAL